MANTNVRNMKLTSVDDLFTTQEQRDEAKLEKVQLIPLTEIDDFPDHPFHIAEGEEMTEMVNSVKAHGVLTPAIARKKEKEQPTDDLDMLYRYKKLLDDGIITEEEYQEMKKEIIDLKK